MLLLTHFAIDNCPGIAREQCYAVRMNSKESLSAQAKLVEATVNQSLSNTNIPAVTRAVGTRFVLSASSSLFFPAFYVSRRFSTKKKSPYFASDTSTPDSCVDVSHLTQV